MVLWLCCFVYHFAICIHLIVINRTICTLELPRFLVLTFDLIGIRAVVSQSWFNVWGGIKCSPSTYCKYFLFHQSFDLWSYLIKTLSLLCWIMLLLCNTRVPQRLFVIKVLSRSWRFRAIKHWNTTGCSLHTCTHTHTVPVWAFLFLHAGLPLEYSSVHLVALI